MHVWVFVLYKKKLFQYGGRAGTFKLITGGLKKNTNKNSSDKGYRVGPPLWVS